MPDVCGAWDRAGGGGPWLGGASTGTGNGPPGRGGNFLVLRENQPILMIVNIEFSVS